MKPTTQELNQDWIDKWRPCQEGIEWLKGQKSREPIAVLKQLIEEKRYNWANWTIVRVMEYRDYVAYAVYAAEQVIDIYEKRYPGDDRPRKAIEAAKKCIKGPSEKNKTAAAYAAAAYVAAAADAAYAAAAAANAAYAAAAYTAAAADAAYTAAAAANAAYDAAADAAYAAREKMIIKILTNGMKLLSQDK